MIMVGTDVHKYNHCAQAVDEVGRPLAVCNVKATDAGHRELVAWARREFGDAEVTFAVEDCRQMSTRLERALLAAGFRVLRVPPKLMAGARASARTRGKSDPIDALAIARAALREPGLPVAFHDTASRPSAPERVANSKPDDLGRAALGPGTPERIAGRQPG